MYKVVAVGHMEQSSWSLGLFRWPKTAFRSTANPRTSILTLRVQRFDSALEVQGQSVAFL